MDTAQWPEGIGVVKSMEEKKQQEHQQQQQQQLQQQQQQAQKPQKPQALNCPRCNSAHTKFCYYNNYSLSQPRYFCKTCRRYWTEGGSLRNVPVGGGSRKNKRSSSSSPSHLSQASSSKVSKLVTPDHQHMGPPVSHFSHQNPNKININNIHEGQDLNLAYPQPNISEFSNLPFNQENKTYPSSTTSTTTTSPQFSAMEFLKSGIASRGFMSSFISTPMSMPLMPVSGSHSNSMNHMYSSAAAAGIPFQEFKPSLNFSLDGFESGYSNGTGLQGVQESGNDNTSARLFFPFEELKPASTTEVLDQQNRGQDDSNSYWNGGGSW